MEYWNMYHTNQFNALLGWYSFSLQCFINTQGNYATRDSSGMCHLMQQRHLSEWREVDEWAFVHCGTSCLNHAIHLTESATKLSNVLGI